MRNTFASKVILHNYILGESLLPNRKHNCEVSSLRQMYSSFIYPSESIFSWTTIIRHKIYFLITSKSHEFSEPYSTGFSIVFHLEAKATLEIKLICSKKFNNLLGINLRIPDFPELGLKHGLSKFANIAVPLIALFRIKNFSAFVLPSVYLRNDSD